MTAAIRELVLHFSTLGNQVLAQTLVDVCSDPQYQNHEFDELMLIAARKEVDTQKSSKAHRLLRLAKLHTSCSHVDQIEYRSDRNLDKSLIDRLATCHFIEKHQNICISGASGTGKTFLAKALCVQACHAGYKSKVVSFPKLMRELQHLQKVDLLKFEKKLRYYSNIPVLLIDEWLSDVSQKCWTNILLELMEMRYSVTSTIICSQLPKENWPKVLSNIALGQAILGRVTAASFTINLEGEDMRKNHATRP
jgi:DNA replication protein DnaC